MREKKNCRKHQVSQAEKACAEDFHSDRKKYSSDSYIVGLQVHQKTSSSCFPACPCWHQNPFTLEMEEDNFLGLISCPDNRQTEK